MQPSPMYTYERGLTEVLSSDILSTCTKHSMRCLDSFISALSFPSITHATK